MIQHDSDLLQDIYDTINDYDKRQNSVHFIDSKLFCYLFLSESKISFITSYSSSLIMISMLSPFKCITRSSSLSIEKIKLFAIVN